MLGCFDSLLYFRAPAHQYLPGKPSGADFLIHLSKLEPQMNKCSTETQSLTVPIQIIFTNKYLLQTVLNLCQDSACSTYQKAKTIEILKMAKARSKPTKSPHTNPSSLHSTQMYHFCHQKPSHSPDCSSTQTGGFLILQFSTTFSHFCGLTHFYWGWTAVRSPAAQKQAQGSAVTTISPANGGDTGCCAMLTTIVP